MGDSDGQRPLTAHAPPHHSIRQRAQSSSKPVPAPGAFWTPAKPLQAIVSPCLGAHGRAQHRRNHSDTTCFGGLSTQSAESLASTSFHGRLVARLLSYLPE